MKKQISVIVTAAMLTSSFCTAASPNNTNAIEEIQSSGILVGDENGNLNLDSKVTRAEFSKLLYEVLYDKDPSNDAKSASFSDLNKSHWSYSYIASLVSERIINGYEDKTFRPDDNILYEEAAKIIAVSANPIITNNNMIYPIDFIADALDNGLLDGVEAVSGEAITRSDAVHMIYNLKNHIKLNDDIKSAEEKSERKDNENILYSGGGTAAAAPESMNSGMSAANAAGGGSSGGGIYAAASGAVYAVSDSHHLPFDTEEYTSEDENSFKNPLTSPLSTFSIDVDTASYSNMRRFLLSGQMPRSGSVRTEELINYFDYDYPLPEDGTPFSVTSETAVCPWNSEHKLAMISVKGAEIPIEERQPSNLVFLIDVSGSMYSENKLPLVKKSLDILLDNLDERDTISVVTYANGTNVLLDSVKASEKEKIRNAVFSLNAYGGTNGHDGISKAYKLAEKNLVDGNNRIILCTDGDFNIGPSSTSELEELVTKNRDMGIFVSVLGFGTRNYKDNRMEILADKGNGNYTYIDNIREAKKVLADEMLKTLYTIAKDVKFQVEFNPSEVGEYRLIGYENRILNSEDFDDDTKDAGELGSGAAVTVFYEIIPASGSKNAEYRYQEINAKPSDELMYLKIRYKEPNENESNLIEIPIGKEISENPSANFKFASAAAELGMILNNSEYKGTSSVESVTKLAREGIDEDNFGFKHEFIQIVDLIKYAK